jgi:hypothetical protein
MEVKDKIDALLKMRSDDKKRVFKQIEQQHKEAKNKKKKTKKKV